MFLLYAVVPLGTAPPTPVGAAGEILEIVEGQAAGLLVGDCRHAPEATRENILEFGRLVSQLHRQGECLPVRYGTTVSSRDRVYELLEVNGERWSRRMRELSGHVELMVHARLHPPRPGTGSGRPSLRARASQHRSREKLAGQLAEVVAPVADEVRRLGGRHEVKVACLVPSDSVERVQDQLDRWASATGQDLFTSGPWPPFSFAEVSEIQP